MNKEILVAEIESPTVETPTQVVKEHDTLQMAVDRYAELDKEIAKKTEKFNKSIKALVGERAELEAKLLEHVEETTDPEDAATVNGVKYAVEFSYRGKKTDILSKDLLIERMGKDLYMDVSTVSLTDIRRYLTDKQLEGVLVEAHVNARRKKIVEL